MEPVVPVMSIHFNNTTYWLQVSALRKQDETDVDVCVASGGLLFK